MTRALLLRLLLTFLSLTLLSACSASKVNIAISSTSNLNAGKGEPSLPVVLRLYQLSEKQSFLKNNFVELWKNDLTDVGPELLTREEIVVRPASLQNLSLALHEETSYLAVMALYKDPMDNMWRDVARVRKKTLWPYLTQRLKIQLDGNSVRIEP